MMNEAWAQMSRENEITEWGWGPVVECGAQESGQATGCRRSTWCGGRRRGTSVVMEEAVHACGTYWRRRVSGGAGHVAVGKVGDERERERSGHVDATTLKAIVLARRWRPKLMVGGCRGIGTYVCMDV